MAVIKYKDANGNWQTVVGVVIQNEVVQETGNSETAVMSQKAATEALNGKLSTSGGTVNGAIAFPQGVNSTITFHDGEKLDAFGNIYIKAGESKHFSIFDIYNNTNRTIFNVNSLSSTEDSSQVDIYTDNDRGLHIMSSSNYSLIEFSRTLTDLSTFFGYRFINDEGFICAKRIYIYGICNAEGFNNISDVRKKDIIDDVNLNVNDIANAPLFKFTWIDPTMEEGVNVGTSAQYWRTILPELTTEGKDDEKTLSMQYGVAALASSVSLAKKVVEQEDRIKALEEAIKELQNKLK